MMQNTSLPWCQDATFLSSIERHNFESPLGPSQLSHDELIELFTAKRQRFLMFELRNITKGRAVFRAGREIFNLGRSLVPGKEFVIEVHYPEFRLPLDHPLLQRSEPVVTIEYTHPKFPRREMLRYLYFQFAFRLNANQDDLRWF
jgi:hypothetical protein